MAKEDTPKKKLSVTEATNAILKGISGDVDTETDEDSDAWTKKKKAKKAAAKKKAVKSMKVAAVPAKKAAAPKKAAAKKKKAAKTTVTPQISDEVSRSQVRCRAADGSSFSFSYEKHGGKKGAMAKARAWLADQ